MADIQVWPCLANRSPGVPRYPKKTILKRKVDARSRDPAPPRAHTPHDTPQWECMQTPNRFFLCGKRILSASLKNLKFLRLCASLLYLDKVEFSGARRGTWIGG